MFFRSKDRIPLRRSGSPKKKRRRTKAHPAGAVDLFRRRCLLGALAKSDPPRLNNSCLGGDGRCLDCTATCLGGAKHEALDSTATCLGHAKHEALLMLDARGPWKISPAQDPHEKSAVVGMVVFLNHDDSATTLSQAILPWCWGLPEGEGVRTVERLQPRPAGERLLRQRPKINASARVDARAKELFLKDQHSRMQTACANSRTFPPCPASHSSCSCDQHCCLWRKNF